jgi:hypothetical protein
VSVEGLLQTDPLDSAKPKESKMRTSTVLSPHELEEREVAKILEQRFGAAWFPEYHRCSIDTDDAFVAVDVDDQFTARLPADERQALTCRLGFVPGTALHVQSSVYHPGSAHLAERVLQTLCDLFDGWALSAI